MSQLEALCEGRPKVSIEAIFGAAQHQPDWDPPPANNWRIKLRYQGRQYSCDFFTGSACGEPTAADVLGCLLADARGVEGARSFEEWAGDMGYDTDSRKAERVYRQIERTIPRLHRLLGDDFEAFANAEH